MSRGRISSTAPSLRGAAAALAVGATALCAPVAGHAASGPAPQRAQAPKLADPPAAQALAPAEPDPASRNTVARARMLECGHQWNNMKRAGTASGTWKDFSRGCLAQR